jgi:Tol biopolymer transport system component
VGIAVIVVLAALSTVLFVRGRARPSEAAPLQVTRVTATGEASAPAISPDRRHVAYVSVDAGMQSIWLRQLATGSTVQLVAPAQEALEGLAFSPDANWLHYLSWPRGTAVRTLDRVPSLGGTARRVYEDVDTHASFSPDGKRILFTRLVPPFGGTILVGDADGSTVPQSLVERTDVELMFPQWSPDGKSIAVSEHTLQSPLACGLAILPPTGGTPVRLGTASWSDVAQICWTPSGDALLVSGLEQGQGGSYQIYAVQAGSGAVRQLTTDLSGYRGVSCSADGRTWVSARRLSVTNLWRVPAAGSAEQNALGALQLTNSTGHVSYPAVSPDGSSVVYSRMRRGTSISGSWVSTAATRASSLPEQLRSSDPSGPPTAAASPTRCAAPTACKCG